MLTLLFPFCLTEKLRQKWRFVNLQSSEEEEREGTGERSIFWFLIYHLWNRFIIYFQNSGCECVRTGGGTSTK